MSETTETATPEPGFPVERIVGRLRELAHAVTQGPDAVRRETTMRVPAEPERDADLVLSAAADALESACKRAEYWKAEHIAGNAEIDRLSNALAERQAHWRDLSAEVERLNAAARESRRRMAEAHDKSLDGWHQTCRAVLTDGIAELDELLPPNAQANGKNGHD